METPLISVVIPTYNRKELLSICLDSLSQQSLKTSQFEVIVVDDGSTDGTGDLLKKKTYPFSLQYIRTENFGPSHARNIGVTSMNGDYIAFLEDDVVAERDWLKNGLRYFRETNVSVIEGRTVYQHTKENIRRFEKYQRFSFIPCNLFVKKEAFNTVGGYDQTFYDSKTNLYFREDADFGFRALDAGYKVYIASDVIVEHPLQFTSFTSCIRHTRRYIFDPLLHKKHTTRFRQLIEVKNILGLTVHRPQHYVALVYTAMLVLIVLKLVLWSNSNIILLLMIVFGCTLIFRFKYQKWDAFKLYKITDTLGFLFLPIIYLYSVIRGCIRYKNYKAIFW